MDKNLREVALLLAEIAPGPFRLNGHLLSSTGWRPPAPASSRGDLLELWRCNSDPQVQADPQDLGSSLLLKVCSENQSALLDKVKNLLSKNGWICIPLGNVKGLGGMIRERTYELKRVSQLSVLDIQDQISGTMAEAIKEEIDNQILDDLIKAAKEEEKKKASRA